jgi:hypothetical protein
MRAALQGEVGMIRHGLITLFMTLAAQAFAQEKPLVTGITEPGSYLCDRTQGTAISCQPTPLLPCGSPVPMRGGSETMAHQHCESLIAERVQNDPGRNLFPRKNAIASCMARWRRSNEVGLVVPTLGQETPTVLQVNRPLAQAKHSVAQEKLPIAQEKPLVTGVTKDGSYFCDWSKSGAISCQPTPVLSCGTFKLKSIDSETLARENCEKLVPQRVQDDQGQNLFPRKNAIAGCLARWRMNKQHLLSQSHSP